MKLNLLMCFFFSFFAFEKPLKDFSFYSCILLTLWFRYLQIRIKENCMYFSSQRFFKTPHQTPKFQEKSKKNKFSNDLQTGISNIFPLVSTMGLSYGATKLSKQ